MGDKRERWITIGRGKKTLNQDSYRRPGHFHGGLLQVRKKDLNRRRPGWTEGGCELGWWIHPNLN